MTERSLPRQSRRHPQIDLLRAHARHEHDAVPRLDCPACRKFAATWNKGGAR